MEITSGERKMVDAIHRLKKVIASADIIELDDWLCMTEESYNDLSDDRTIRSEILAALDRLFLYERFVGQVGTAMAWYNAEKAERDAELKIITVAEVISATLVNNINNALVALKAGEERSDAKISG